MLLESHEILEPWPPNMHEKPCAGPLQQHAMTFKRECVM